MLYDDLCTALLVGPTQDSISVALHPDCFHFASPTRQSPCWTAIRKKDNPIPVCAVRTLRIAHVVSLHAVPLVFYLFQIWSLVYKTAGIIAIVIVGQPLSYFDLRLLPTVWLGVDVPVMSMMIGIANALHRLDKGLRYVAVLIKGNMSRQLHDRMLRRGEIIFREISEEDCFLALMRLGWLVVIFRQTDGCPQRKWYEQ